MVMAAGRFEIRAVAAWEAESDNDGPDVSFVPPLARRRLTGVERAALAVAWKVRSEGDCPVVFASRWGEIGVTLKLMRQLHDEESCGGRSMHKMQPSFIKVKKNPSFWKYPKMRGIFIVFQSSVQMPRREG